MGRDIMRGILTNLLVAAALSIASVAQTAAEPGDEAYEALQDGEYATALRLVLPIAEQGEAWAQFNLGLMYHLGHGVQQDDVEAAKWFRLAAEQGDAAAQMNLGSAYRHGQGVQQDNNEAVRWFRLAAEQGETLAQNNLGVMYAEGRGVLQDNVMAHMWFNLSASQGNPRATKNRDTVASRMTTEQIAEAQMLAREWAAAHPQP